MKRLPLLALALAGCPAAPVGPPPSQDAVVATIPLFKTPHGVDTAGGFVYVGSIDGEAIGVIDAATNALVKTIPRPGGQVVYVLPFPDGKQILALDNKKGEVLVIDPAKGHEIVQAVAVGLGPDEAAFAADGSVVVALADEDHVVRLTFEADRTKAPTRQAFAVGTAAGATNRHRPLGHMTGWALVPNTGDNDATLVDLAKGTARHLADGNNPGPVAIAGVDGQAQVAMVGYRASHRVVFYDLAGGEPTRIDGQGLFPQAIAWDAASRKAFVVMSSSNELSVFDWEKRAPLGRVKVGSRPVEAHVWPGFPDAARRQVWCGNDGGDSVSVVDVASQSLVATIAAGAGHHHLCTANGKVFVSNLESGTVTVIDRAAVKGP